MMPRLACLWYRSRLEPYMDGALEGRAARAVGGHVERCACCRQIVERLARMRDLVRAAAGIDEPDWSSFWPAVRARIAADPPRPIWDPWWLPWWKPVWGHPRLASSAALAGALLVSFMVWPGGRELPLASASPVVVQDVAVADPRGSVMVYSNRDQVTVIWVFASDPSED